MNTTLPYEHLERVRQYIDRNLDRSLALDELAKMACSSKFHFHRIFKAVYGEPLGAYVKRIRLEAGARQLVYSDTAVSELAYDSGYESVSSFSTAFRKHFGVSPQTFRNNKTSIIMNNEVNTKDYAAIEPAEFRILKDETILFKNVTGDYVGPLIPEAWQKLWETVGKLGLMYDGMLAVGIPHDDPHITKPENCRYDAAVSLKEKITPPQGYGVKHLDGGKYAVFTHKGDYESLINTYDAALGKWLLESKHELREVPILEIYLNFGSDVQPQDLLTEVLIPVN